MDSKEKSQVCPWCQTEIVWDPEFGPEETCPHCTNELGGYKSIKLKLRQDDGDLSLEEEDEEALASGSILDEEDEEALEVDDLLDDYTVERERDEYSEKVIAVMDQQEYAPECTNCHELMLHAGVRRVSGSGFEPMIPLALGDSFLSAPYALDVFVCPSCFKTDEYLTKASKEDMIRVFAPGREEV